MKLPLKAKELQNIKDILESRQAPGAIVRGNIAYQSPITGQPVTTWRQRQYDLESNNCVDAREGAEMAADARKYHKKNIITAEDVARAAAQLGV